MKRIYLDHSATTPVDKQVVAEMLPFFTDEFGNASSIHGFGRSAKVALEGDRERVATVIGAIPGEIVFTGSGSESDNLAIIGTATAFEHKGRHIITNKTEHHAVLHTFEALEKKGFTLSYIECDEYGMINPKEV